MALELTPVERMIGNEEPLERIYAALDEFLTRPDAATLRRGVESLRVTAACVYGRPPEECAAVLDGFLAVEPDLVLRAEATWLTCSSVPELVPRYLDSLIAELEAAPHNPRIADVLGRVRAVRDRTLGTRPAP